MAPLQPSQLVDLHEIQLVKARYFRLVDAKDWSALQQLFTTDAIFHHPALGQLPVSQAVQAVASRIPSSVTTIHHAYMPEIRFVKGEEEHRAVGIWSMSSLSFVPVEGEPAKALDGKVQRTMGEYTDRFRKEGEEWMIESLVLRSTYREDVGLMSAKQ